MIVVWLKLLHVASLAVWAGGILLMPLLLGQREVAGEGPPLHRLHAFTRFAYIGVVSPAAFVAIASGTALIVERGIAAPWFALKLLLVGVLVALHVWIGLLVLSIFDEGGRFARWRVTASVVVLCGLMTAVFWLVLAKPDIPLAVLPASLLRPGGLRTLAEGLIPGLTP
ncbi:MAG: CopD family protein [Methylobacterium frigidaeris]